jgi:hypothetical protein
MVLRECTKQHGAKSHIQDGPLTFSLGVADGAMDLAKDMPTSEDVTEQFWHQGFRQAIRDNMYIVPRPVEKVAWASFPTVATFFGQAVGGRNPLETHGLMKQIVRFTHTFFCALNSRLTQRDDIKLLEACSIFDHRHAQKSRNQTMRPQYMGILLHAFKTEKAQFVKIGATLWFQRRKEFAESDGEQSIIEHFASLSQSAHNATRAYGEWALNIRGDR